MAALRFMKKWGPYVLVLFLLVLGAEDLFSRPGGGSSFGGGSSGGGGFSSGGGGGGGDEGLGYLIYLAIRYPHIGIPLLVIFIAFKIYNNRNKPRQTVHSTAPVHSRGPVKAQTNAAMDAYRGQDPNFSQTIFLDFVQHLYYQYHHWRGKAEFRNLSPYIAREVFEREANLARTDLEVSELVIGSVDIVGFNPGTNHDSITIRVEANYTETRRGHSNRFWVQDQWIFVRRKGVVSKGPEELEGLHCPNCGSNLDLTPSGACSHCAQTVSPGEQHWMLHRARHLNREVQKGKRFGTYEAERGTSLPTIYDPSLRMKGRSFMQKHQIADMGAYFEDMKASVIGPAFNAIYASWESQDYLKARPLLTDNLFRSHKYWIEAYKSEGLVNRLQDLQIHSIDLAKIDLDKFYESFTVRIAASVYDFLENRKGKVVGGSSRQKRTFTEYWTFVRRSGVTKDPSEYSTDSCPNCGAPIDMGMTGECSYCKSKVTTGEFGWVLSRITQDEVYHG